MYTVIVDYIFVYLVIFFKYNIDYYFFRHANDKRVEKIEDLHPDMVVKVLGLFFIYATIIILALMNFFNPMFVLTVMFDIFFRVVEKLYHSSFI